MKLPPRQSGLQLPSPSPLPLRHFLRHRSRSQFSFTPPFPLFFTLPPFPDSLTPPLFIPCFPLPRSSSLPWRRLGRTLMCDELFWKVPGVQRRCWCLLSFSTRSPLFPLPQLLSLSLSLLLSFFLSLSLPRPTAPPSLHPPHLHSHHTSLGDWQPPQRVRAGTDGIWMVHSCMKKVSGWRKWCRGTLNCELSMTKSHCNHRPLPNHTHTHTHTQTHTHTHTHTLSLPQKRKWGFKETVTNNGLASIVFQIESLENTCINKNTFCFLFTLQFSDTA